MSNLTIDITYPDLLPIVKKSTFKSWFTESYPRDLNPLKLANISDSDFKSDLSNVSQENLKLREFITKYQGDELNKSRMMFNSERGELTNSSLDVLMSFCESISEFIHSDKRKRIFQNAVEANYLYKKKVYPEEFNEKKCLIYEYGNMWYICGNAHPLLAWCLNIIMKNMDKIYDALPSTLSGISYVLLNDVKSEASVFGYSSEDCQFIAECIALIFYGYTTVGIHGIFALLLSTNALTRNTFVNSIIKRASSLKSNKLISSDDLNKAFLKHNDDMIYMFGSNTEKIKSILTDETIPDGDRQSFVLKLLDFSAETIKREAATVLEDDLDYIDEDETIEDIRNISLEEAQSASDELYSVYLPLATLTKAKDMMFCINLLTVSMNLLTNAQRILGVRINRIHQKLKNMHLVTEIKADISKGIEGIIEYFKNTLAPNTVITDAITDAASKNPFLKYVIRSPSNFVKTKKYNKYSDIIDITDQIHKYSISLNHVFGHMSLSMYVNCSKYPFLQSNNHCCMWADNILYINGITISHESKGVTIRALNVILSLLQDLGPDMTVPNNEWYDDITTSNTYLRNNKYRRPYKGEIENVAQMYFGGKHDAITIFKMIVSFLVVLLIIFVITILRNAYFRHTMHRHMYR